MKKILIVEDELELAENIKELLEEDGYDVPFIFENAHDTLNYLHENQVDLILMDIQIKGQIDGIDLAYKIKEDSSTPIVFSTAYSSREILDRFSQNMYDGYLVKPFTRDSLHASIHLGLKRGKEKKLQKPVHIPILKIIDKGLIVPLPVTDILYMKAYGLYSKVVTSAKIYVIRDILKNVEEKLPKEHFLRVHKSYLVNLCHVDMFNAKKISIKEHLIPVRRGLYNELKERMKVD